MAEAVATGRGKHRVPGRAQRFADHRRRSLGSPRPGLGGAIIIAKFIIHPITAGAALFFTIRGKIPYALVAMAFVILMSWLSFLPSIQLHGLNLEDGDAIATMLLVCKIILAPVLALVIAALALTKTWLTLATVLAILPTLAQVLAVIAFGISVAIYGF
jgi:hypothetical protein